MKNSPWVSHSAEPAFGWDGEREIYATVGLSSKFEVELRKLFLFVLFFPPNFFLVMKRSKLFLRLVELGLKLASVSFIAAVHSLQ